MPYTGTVAAEPGLDYRTIDVEGFDNSAEVTVTDYSSDRFLISKKTERFRDLEEFFGEDRPSWSKVRWINVDGLNWQCIKLLAIKYNLHRLAIEDLLSVQRTKIDIYPDRNRPPAFMTNDSKDIYVCLLMHVLIGDDSQIVVDDKDTTSKQKNDVEGSLLSGDTVVSRLKRLFTKRHKPHDSFDNTDTLASNDKLERVSSLPIAQHYNPDRKLIYENVRSSRESALTVAMEQVSIFLTSDGTVISFFQVDSVNCTCD